MIFRRILVIPFLILSACDENGTNPSRELDDTVVGSWRYTSTNVFDLFGERLRSFFAGLQLSEDEIEEAVQQTIQQTREDFNIYNPDEVLTFQADGAWSSNVVGAGTWRVDGDELFLSGAGTSGLDITYQYVVDADNLTISIDRLQAVDILAQTENLSDELLGLFTSLFAGSDVFSYSLTRVD